MIRTLHGIYITLILYIFALTGWTQVPSGYYDSAIGLSGYTLKTKLHQIISQGHEDQGYSALYDAYESTDTDLYYENDGSVLDMYSERPTQADPYNYQHGNDTCGQYNDEGDCYNREHIIPQSVFNSAYPMKSDVHFVVPSDGYVNNRRSNYPFGEVNNPSWISDNGSKVGSNTAGSYTGTVFEPIDEFKGDIARMLFYFATRYEDQIDNWDFDMFDGSSHKVFKDWALNMLMEWHTNDPVSQRELDRNNAAYNFQGNANPYIDHPEWVNTIWNPDSGLEEVNSAGGKPEIYPNPAKRNMHIKDSSVMQNIIVYDLLGNEILSLKPAKKELNIDISSWFPGTYFVKIINGERSITLKFIKEP